VEHARVHFTNRKLLDRRQLGIHYALFITVIVHLRPNLNSSHQQGRKRLLTDLIRGYSLLTHKSHTAIHWTTSNVLKAIELCDRQRILRSDRFVRPFAELSYIIHDSIIIKGEMMPKPQRMVHSLRSQLSKSGSA
jgi:hypothetical protein